MAAKLNPRAFDMARTLVREGRLVTDDRDQWSEHQPSAAAENAFIREHGFDEYALWHLGMDTDQPRDTKKRYKFPYGDFERIHRCAVLAAESRAAQRHHADIQSAAAHLHGMLDALLMTESRAAS
jgi:hypothetical protein